MSKTKRAPGRPSNASKIEELKENEQLLQAELAELRAATQESVVEPESRDKIPQDDYITVISLCPNTLCLSREKGDKQTKIFREFGESKRIIYSVLVQIMEHHHNFLHDGFFYIADQRVIRAHGLDEAYSKILTESTIKRIVNGNEENIEEVFMSANKAQRKFIVQMIIERILNPNIEMNLNMVDRLERASGIKINEAVAYRRYLEDLETEVA